MAVITTTVNENNPLTVNLVFLDVNDVPFIPQSVSWRLWDDTNKEMLQDWTSIDNPGTATSLEIPGSLNTIGNPNNLSERHMFLLQTIIPGGEPRYDNSYYNVIAIPDLN